ncbi:MAG: hypothetical protein A3E83_01860 [Gammaproteobacteria bacterium RIFCSPHIGHO2_12_FULL_41_20]|nr:MAG: hypothetical protein A3E83_01860 [Gammaproteobacteria bacterium RIFCSPHIGHO2_12_FULL_41_20]
MIQNTLATLAKILNTSTDTPNITYTGVSIDTRTLQPQNLFVAITGEHADGHNFIEEAQRQGAHAALVQHKVASTLPQVAVSDTIVALGKIAAAQRKQFTLPLIAVTGSNGKTTLKNMIASILQAACGANPSHMLATTGNLNNHLGLPLTLTRLDKQHRYAVLEMGMNHPGEIAYLTKIAQPSVAVINNAAPAHLEGLQDVIGVARAKGEIFLGLQPHGIGILNRDDAFFDLWKNLLGKHEFLTFGIQQTADVTAVISASASNISPVFTLQTPMGHIDIHLPLPGRHNIMNALAAAATTLAVNIDLPTIKAGLESVRSAPGRLQIYPIGQGIRLIDDTYNANPASLGAAIDMLASQDGKKILILGDMKELGPQTEALHFHAGQSIKNSGIDYLFTFGQFSAETSRGFGEKAQHFNNQQQVAEAVKPLLHAPATVLIKGSRSMRMENIVAMLKTCVSDCATEPRTSLY